jgi:hypothetical protein
MGVRKEIAHSIMQKGIRHGCARRIDNKSVEVVIVLPPGLANLDDIIGELSHYFGPVWNVTEDRFVIDEHCSDRDMIQLLEKPFEIVKSSEPNAISDENCDTWSEDGWEIRSVGNPFGND